MWMTLRRRMLYLKFHLHRALACISSSICLYPHARPSQPRCLRTPEHDEYFKVYQPSVSTGCLCLGQQVPRRAHLRRETGTGEPGVAVGPREPPEPPSSRCSKRQRRGVALISYRSVGTTSTTQTVAYASKTSMRHLRSLLLPCQCHVDKI